LPVELSAVEVVAVAPVELSAAEAVAAAFVEVALFAVEAVAAAAFVEVEPFVAEEVVVSPVELSAAVAYPHFVPVWLAVVAMAAVSVVARFVAAGLAAVESVDLLFAD